MKETPSASFRFKNYIITDFAYTMLRDTDDEDINIGISVSGVFNKATGNYILNMNFFAASDAENTNKFITATLNGLFEFKDKIETPPDFFYPNSMGIVFPYLRAYISVVTNMANTGPVMIPTLNLMSLTKELKDNTQIIEDDSDGSHTVQS